MFNLDNEKAIVKTKPQNRVAEKIFDKYKRITLEKLDKSISEGNGRYNQTSENYRPHSTAKPSLNWKVYNKAENIEDELLEIWLKVGIKKVVIGVDKNTLAPTETMRFAPMEAIGKLVELRQMIDGLTRENGKEFWEVAVTQAKPKTKPTAKDKEGNLLYSDWKYDDEVDSSSFDTYIAIK